MSCAGQRTTETKLCACCGQHFKKLSKITRSQWERARFCSNECRVRTMATDPIRIRRYKLWWQKNYTPAQIAEIAAGLAEVRE